MIISIGSYMEKLAYSHQEKGICNQKCYYTWYMVVEVKGKWLVLKKKNLIDNSETIPIIAWSSDYLPIEHRRKTPSGLTVN